MLVVYNEDRSAAHITGDYSPHPIYAMIAVVEALGGSEKAYHEIKRLQNAVLLPRKGSKARPLTERDMRYARENEARHARHWQWYDLEGFPVKRDTGYDFVNGYGYADASGTITLVNANDEPVYVIGV